MRGIKLTQDDFWGLIDKTDTCWLWKGPRIPANVGYGYFSYHLAHRVMWEIENGVIPKGKLICHSCDNPPCVNPSHLFIGTQKDNMRDASQKHRLWMQQHPERVRRGDQTTFRLYPELIRRGEQHHSHLHPELVPRGEKASRSKLKEQDVRAIHRLRGSGTSLKELSSLYQVSIGHIEGILSGRYWKHLGLRTLIRVYASRKDTA